MKKGLSLLLIALLLFFTLGLGTEAVKLEDVKVLETLIELMSGKLGEYQDQFKDFKGLLGNLSGKIGDIESKSEALNQMDRWLRTKIEDTEKSLREQITTGEVKQQSAIEEKIRAVTQRLTGIDSGISNLKGEIEAIYQEIYRLGFELFEALEESGQETTQKNAFIQSQIDLLYKKIKQLEGKDGSGASALDGISSDIALLKEIIGYVDQANVGLWNAASVREKEAEARYEEINLRLKSVENAFIALRSEDADTRNALDEMISGVGLLQQSVASLQANDKFLWNKVDIAERQLVAKFQAGNEQFAQLLTEKVSALNLRLKWVDGSIEKLKGDLKALDKDVLELSAGLERLRKEQASGNGNLSQVIDDRVWAINKRLGWTDGAVAKLKTDLGNLQKKLNEAITSLEEETLNRIWGVNKRLMWLENQVSQIKNENGQSGEILGLSIANLELEV